MKKRYWMRWLDSSSDNRKSKSGPADQNPKWIVLVAFAVAIAMCGPVAEAQQQAKVAKIGEISFSGSSGSPRSELFRRVLRELGHVEGKNMAFETRSAAGKLDRLPALVDEFVRLNVDLIFVSEPNAALAAKNATRTIPSFL